MRGSLWGFLCHMFRRLQQAPQRRKIPFKLVEHLGIKAFTYVLGRTDKEAAKAFASAHMRYQQMIAKTRREIIENDLSGLTELEKHLRTIQLAKKLVKGEHGIGWTPEEADIELDNRMIGQPLDEYGCPLAEPDLFKRALLYIRNRGNLSAPQPILEDAKRLY